MASSSELPTILLIPGAFTGPNCYDWLAPELTKVGHPVVRATLITCNPQNQDPRTCTAEQQCLDLLNTYLRPLIEDQGKDVLVFAHSFGATACGGANSSLTKPERSLKGLPGGIIGIIHIACALVRDGETQLQHMGGAWPSFCQVDWPSEGLLTFNPVIETLWNDLSPQLHQKLVPTHLPHASRPFATAVKDPLWMNDTLAGRRIYLLTKRDQAFPVDVQRIFVGWSWVDWDVREVDAGHAGFIGKAEEVTKIIAGAARRWVRGRFDPMFYLLLYSAYSSYET